MTEGSALVNVEMALVIVGIALLIVGMVLLEVVGLQMVLDLLPVVLGCPVLEGYQDMVVDRQVVVALLVMVVGLQIVVVGLKALVVK